MSPRPRVYINEILDFDGTTHRELEAAGVEVTYGRAMWDEPSRIMSEAELIEKCRDADAVMGSSRDRFTRGLFEACPRLRIVSKYGIGTERIDVAAATELGLLVGNTPVRENYTEVSEHTVTLMLAAVRRLRQVETHMRGGGWRGPESTVGSLDGKTIGLVGLGRIAREVVRRLGGWEVEVIAHDPYVKRSEAAALGVELVSLEELFERSDLISPHVVINEETHQILGRAAFERMKPGVTIVNTSRGQAIDEEALLWALDQGIVAGAALDVFDPEPPDLDGALLRHPDVLVTPHVAGFTTRTVGAIVVAAKENLLAALRSEVPANLKNPEAVDAWRARFPDPVLAPAETKREERTNV
jgi:D-3-phosphoglycerate dehydrogenase / 2-oxoglutarate reductase